MRFCGGHRLFSRRSSTANRSDRRLHRRPPGPVRGRAHLPGTADGPFHLLRLQEAAAERQDVKEAAHAVDSAAQVRQFHRRVRRVLRFLYELPDEEHLLLARDLALDDAFVEVHEELQDLRREIEALLRKVQEYRQADA